MVSEHKFIEVQPDSEHSRTKLSSVMRAIAVAFALALVPQPCLGQYGTYGKIQPVVAAVATSLAQNNAFNLNIGVQDFQGRLIGNITDLTMYLRQLVIEEQDPAFRNFLNNQVLQPFEKIRAQLILNFENVTNANLQANAANKNVNDIINQVNKLGDQIYKAFHFDGKVIFVYDIVDKQAIYDFIQITKDFQRVIDLHKDAVDAAAANNWKPTYP